MNTKYLEPFADWLSISFPTSQSPHMDILSLISSHTPLTYVELGGGKELYKTERDGTVHITSKDNYVNLSLSGSILAAARSLSFLTELETLCSSSPYNITRLDIAYDVPIAGHLVLSSIQRTYPTGYANVAGRERQLQFITNQLDSKTQTGTAYF